MVPRIIHQIWFEGKDNIPQPLDRLSFSWKNDYPNWKYECWDKARIPSFLDKNSPQYQDSFNSLYDIQRFDNHEKDIHIIPPKYITPLTVKEAFLVRNGCEIENIQERLKEAYAIHYFWGSWCNSNDKN